MAPFNPPDWAAQPCRVASLEVQDDNGSADTLPIDIQAYYTMGREAPAVDILLDHPSCSRIHFAIVHHQDGRVFGIDLQSAQGTKLNGAKMQPNKPTVLKEGCRLQFAQCPRTYVVHCESAAEKRAGDATEQEHPAGKRPAAEAPPPPQQWRASHLLVKHRESRRPSSWKEKQVTRSKEEALQMIQAFREQIVSGQADFGDLAQVESHCSSAQRQGDLGWFGVRQMQPVFEQATAALAVGELSQPVFTDSGVHLILRTG